MGSCRESGRNNRDGRNHGVWLWGLGSMPRPLRPLDRTPAQKTSMSVSPAAHRRTSSGRSGTSFARSSDFFRLPIRIQSTVGDRLAQMRPFGKILNLCHEQAEADLRSACQMRGDGVGASARQGCQSISVPNAHPNRAGRARFALTLPATNYASPAGPCRGRGTCRPRRSSSRRPDNPVRLPCLPDTPRRACRSLRARWIHSFGGEQTERRCGDRSRRSTPTNSPACPWFMGAPRRAMGLLGEKFQSYGQVRGAAGILLVSH